MKKTTKKHNNDVPPGQRFIYVVHGLQYTTLAGDFEGRTFQANPGVFFSLEEAEFHCRTHSHSKFGIHLWYERVEIGRYSKAHMRRHK